MASDVTGWGTSDYPPDWDERRKRCYERDDYECRECGATGGPRGDAELHAHHVVPKSEGGSHELWNLKTLCASCHDDAHDHPVGGTARDDGSPRRPRGGDTDDGDVETASARRSAASEASEGAAGDDGIQNLGVLSGAVSGFLATAALAAWILGQPVSGLVALAMAITAATISLDRRHTE